MPDLAQEVCFGVLEVPLSQGARRGGVREPEQALCGVHCPSVLQVSHSAACAAKGITIAEGSVDSSPASVVSIMSRNQGVPGSKAQQRGQV